MIHTAVKAVNVVQDKLLSRCGRLGVSLRDIAASFGLSHFATSPSIGNNLVDHIIAACSKLRESDGIVVLGNRC